MYSKLTLIDLIRHGRLQVDAGILHANLALTEDMAFGCYLYAMTPNKKTGYVPVSAAHRQTQYTTVQLNTVCGAKT